MSKKLFLSFVLFIALFVGAFYYTNIIQSPIISTQNKVKSTYFDIVEYIDKIVQKHFFQASHIEELSERLQMYENNHLVMRQLANEVQNLYKLTRSKLTSNPKVQLVRAISYENFGEFNRVWMDIKDYNASKIYGLTYKELVAGIVVPKDGKPLGLLNKDIKSVYAVYIGEQKAPGIAHGNNGENIIIKFIPAWYKIKKDDEVITSGLDGIFFKGLKVGRVLSVSSSQGYQNAVVKPYYEANELDYFYMIKEVR